MKATKRRRTLVNQCRLRGCVLHYASSLLLLVHSFHSLTSSLRVIVVVIVVVVLLVVPASGLAGNGLL
jgi:hypothetical protein